MFTLKKGFKDVVSLFSRKNPFAHLSYSQCGEDLIVQHVFNMRNIPLPSYLDIGAHHPYFLSNTALFYEKGSRGITVEANPQLTKLFKVYRRKDIHLNVGIGVEAGELDFFIMKDSTLSTFSKQEADDLAASGMNIKEVKRINLKTVNQILEENCQGIFPDFLSIDVEGMDFSILQSIAFDKAFPKVICVEAVNYSLSGAGSRRNDLMDFLKSKNYFEYATTYLNSIMVKEEFWYQP